jgi:molybdate transport system substrate-binding protein
VPVGRYTQGVLEAAGLWSAIEPKMIGATSVRQALDYVARGEVDAGFVYATDAALMPDKVKVAMTVADVDADPLPGRPAETCARTARARQFVAFLASDAAQAVFARQRVRQALTPARPLIGRRMGRAGLTLKVAGWATAST